MSDGRITRGWAEFAADAVPSHLDADERAALELAWCAGAAHALHLVAQGMNAGELPSTLGPVLLAWGDEIVARSDRVAQEVLGEQEGNGERGCWCAGAAHALHLVGDCLDGSSPPSTLGAVLQAWGDEIVARSDQIGQEVLGEEGGNGARGC
jgi:hypothetical protein